MTDLEVNSASSGEAKSSSSSESVCCLCLCVYGRDVVILECGHRLHSNCLTELLIKSFEHNRQYRCPLCRCELKNYSGLDGNKLKAEYMNLNEHTTLIIPTQEQIQEQYREQERKEFINFVFKILGSIAVAAIMGSIIYYWITH